jgi:monofunctional chorismate mutase
MVQSFLAGFVLNPKNEVIMREETGVVDDRKELASLREEIDRVDRELVRLMEERMRIARRIGAWKAERGMAVLDAAREEEKLASIRALVSEKQNEDAVCDLFRSLMAASRSAQEQLKRS